MENKKFYRVEVITCWHSPVHEGLKKRREMLFNFQDRDLDPDRREWPHHEGILDTKRSPEIYVEDYERAAKVFHEILDERDDWQPFGVFKGSPEYFEYCQVVSRDENGREKIVRMASTHEGSFEEGNIRRPIF